MEILIKLLGAFVFLGLFLSLFMPRKLGFFLSNPTRLKVFGCYFLGAVVMGALIQGLYPPLETDRPLTGVTISGGSDRALPELYKPKSTDAVALKKDYAALYKELQGFKGKADFHRRGFTEGGPYADWKDRVHAADEAYDGHTQIGADLIFGDLAMLGLEYMRSKGQETQYTRDMTKEIKKALR